MKIHPPKAKMKLRPPTPEDVPECGQIIYDAFCSIADKHNFPYDFPTIESAIGMAEMSINNPSIYGVVAEIDGKVVGSNFLWEYDAIRGVGPITIAPDTQSKGIGRELMQDVIDRGKGAEGVRLVQDSFNAASLSLYASLGFEVVEPLALMEGVINSNFESEGTEVREIRETDLEACATLARSVLGHDRNNELTHIASQFPGYVALRDGWITAYASAPSIWQLNHAVAEDVSDMKTLLSGAARLTKGRLSFLLPTRQAELFRWCLSGGLWVVKPMTLMAMGDYEPPRVTYLPSVLY